LSIHIEGKQIKIFVIISYFIFSPDQSRPNNADFFLLLLNNTSRPLRNEFESQTNKSTVMAHRYQRKTNNQTHSSRRTSTDSNQSTDFTASNERAQRIHRSEVVFLRTSNKVIAPFTLFTIPLSNNISVLILVEVNFVNDQFER
jgi:hypothetical protein